MAKSRFDLGALLAGTGLPSQSPPQAAATAPPEGEPSGAGVFNSDTEQIVLIPLELIDPDPSNFYSLDGLDALAGNIELIGLMDPLRVRPAEGRYIVVSGHRRRAALMMIRDGGGPLFQEGGRYATGVPCIVEYGEASDAMRELRLIYANSATRVMTSAELSRQAERVTELLYQLKGQGVEFPGRMRDHVAEACRVSSSKLARLHAIRENLIPQFLERYDAGTINESVAYRLSQESACLQVNLNLKLGPAVQGISAETLEACITQEKQSVLEDEPSQSALPTAPPEGEPRECSAIDGLKKYLDGKSDEDRRFWKGMQSAADSLIDHSFRSGAGPNRKENIDMLRVDCRNCGVGGYAADWEGRNDGLTLYHLSRHPIKRTWTEVYDALAAIAISRWRDAIPRLKKLEHDNERLKTALDKREAKKTDCHTSAAALVRNDGDGTPRWQTGTPEREGYYAARLRLYDRRLPSPRVIWWDGESWYNAVGDDIRQHRLDRAITVEAWCQLPEE